MNSGPGISPRIVRCPGCGQRSEFAPANPYRPFCSERCKNGDLGAWANERYRVEASPPVDGDDESSSPQAP
ncbi:DNA gyrase inhibitor YacG [Methylibium sp.]|uniref:DNA gyrase inhibitor YacG n=1 Tax=Methylibium sp. TaxID=2067992 RepID=UPI003D0CF725